METLLRTVRGMFRALDGLQLKLSDHWREGANRRTIVLVAILGSLSLYGYLFHIRPPALFPTGHLVTVESGTTVDQISRSLKTQGVVRSPLFFKAFIRILGSDENLRAGDYLFKEPKDVFAIARAISAGAFGLEPIRVRVPEGATVAEIALIFDRRLERFDETAFLERARDAEGYLFPDTYFFMPNATDETVYGAMRQNFDAHIASIFPPIASSSHSLSDIVIMASIIERESHDAEDRRLISGVLWNRIERDMALQVDAPFVYSIGKGTFQLTMRDLTSDSPYNTYKHKGLPPTAIGNPSLDSIKAALQPTENDYLFFLADKEGVTHFCKTYQCQLANKARYF